MRPGTGPERDESGMVHLRMKHIASVYQHQNYLLETRRSERRLFYPSIPGIKFHSMSAAHPSCSLIVKTVQERKKSTFHQEMMLRNLSLELIRIPLKNPINQWSAEKIGFARCRAKRERFNLWSGRKQRHFGNGVWKTPAYEMHTKFRSCSSHAQRYTRHFLIRFY